jgi:hypothetical protein
LKNEHNHFEHKDNNQCRHNVTLFLGDDVGIAVTAAAAAAGPE